MSLERGVRRAVEPARPPAAEPSRGARPSRDPFTIEQAAAIESPREFRLSPDGRRVAYTAEAAGARQIFVLQLRGGYPEQVTASEKAISDPQWSPDGRRLAFVRDDAIWMIELEAARQVLVTQHPAGNRTPRWCADGHRIAFVSRRRGWDQVWVVDAPVPRRGRPASRPRSPEPRPLTATGVDVEDFSWSPDGRFIAVTSQRGPDLLTSQVHVLDVATGDERLIAGATAWETGPRWLRDGSGLLLVSDESGWFQVVRVSLDGSQRQVLTSGSREHGEPGGGWGYVPLPSPDGRSFVYSELHDGLVELHVGVLPPASGAPRPVRATTATNGWTELTGGDHEVVGDAGDDADGDVDAARIEPATLAAAIADPSLDAPSVRTSSHRSAVVNPFHGVWMSVDWLPDSSAILAIGESDRAPEDLWLLPIPDVAPDGARPRQLTRSMPLAVDANHLATGIRIAFTARDGRRIEGLLYLPAAASGEGAVRVPCVVHSHGGPTSQAHRDWLPFRQLVVEAGMAFLSVDFRGSTGYGRQFRWANRGEWGHADAFDVIDAARWAAGQPWCDGRLAHYGASYGGYLTLCVLTEEPSLWRAGIDLYGDSDIAESYRHGDRVGRIDLERMMGRPDDPAAAEAYRRGSPLFRAERIEAPLLILHGRNDKRVVPLMSEKIVEALEIEGKHHQVQWYDGEAHGWQKRENRRDAWRRCIEFLKRHLLEQTDAD